jgi:phosphate:Na+ symporter
MRKKRHFPLIAIALLGAAGTAFAAGPGQAPGLLEDPATLLAYMSAGIGIFLVGVKYIGSHLQQMSGGSFRNVVARISASPTGVFLAGNFLGFFTQSGKASSFILAGFVQAGLLTVVRALPLVFWCNAGASIIVIASVLPIKMLVMFLLGITGLGITFHWPRKFLHAYGALFGIGMIMYGLFLLKMGAAGFIDYPWLPPLLEQMRGVFILSLLIGVLLTLVAQSDMAVAMITIAMAASGLFALEESAMVVYGTQAGAAILTYGFSFNFSGRARQVVISQVAFKAIVTVVFVLLFFVELFFGVPLLHALARAISGDVGLQVATITLILSFAGAILMQGLGKPILVLVEKLYPPSPSEALSEPRFVNSPAAESPETALLLIEQEQLELLQRLPSYLDYIRQRQNGGKSIVHPSDYHEAFDKVSEGISQLLSAISGQGLNEKDSANLIRATKTHEQLVSLEDTVFKITSRLEAHDATDTAASLGQKILESLDFIILIAIDAIRSGDREEIDALADVTGDRSEMMDQIRRRYLQAEEELSPSDRNFVLDITILFENGVAALGRSAQLLRADP